MPHTDWAVNFGPQARFGGFAAGMGPAVAMTALGDRGRLRVRSAIPLATLAAAGLHALSLLSVPENFAFAFYHPLASALWLLLFSTLPRTGAPDGTGC